MQAVEELTVFHNIVAAVQVKQEFSLKEWDEGTLDDMGCYTPQSDTYQIGVMLLKSQHLSADGLIFAQKLKSKTVKAVDAAEHPTYRHQFPCLGMVHTFTDANSTSPQSRVCLLFIGTLVEYCGLLVNVV